MKLYQYLEYSTRDRVAYLTLNRPDKRNALNDVMVVELKDAFMAAEQDPMVKVLVIQARGPAFCAGADLEYLQRMQQYNEEQNLADSSSLAQLMLAIYRSIKVVIAQVEGHAIAGGCGLVTVCDFAFVVPEAKLGYTEARIGFVPAIVMAFLLRKVGETRAKELLLTGRLIDASTAVRYNLVNDVVPQDEIRAHVAQFAQQLCTQCSQASMQLTKKMIADIQDFPLEHAVKFAARMNAVARRTEDCQRGIAAFLDKEDLTW
ncbi:MAG: enoyl-CoA hydratase-related protein [Bacteroidia bacterium]